MQRPLGQVLEFIQQRIELGGVQIWNCAYHLAYRLFSGTAHTGSDLLGYSVGVYPHVLIDGGVDGGDTLACQTALIRWRRDGHAGHLSQNGVHGVFR